MFHWHSRCSWTYFTSNVLDLQCWASWQNDVTTLLIKPSAICSSEALVSAACLTKSFLSFFFFFLIFFSFLALFWIFSIVTSSSSLIFLYAVSNLVLISSSDNFISDIVHFITWNSIWFFLMFSISLLIIYFFKSFRILNIVIIITLAFFLQIPSFLSFFNVCFC